MTSASSGSLLAGQTTIFHMLTSWNTSSEANAWILSGDAAQNGAYDQAAVDWLAQDIVSHSQGTNFIQAMAYPDGIH